MLLEGGVVDQDIELPELLDRAIDRSGAERGSATSPEIVVMQRRHSFSMAALVLAASPLVQGRHRDIGALAHNENGDPTPDAGTAPVSPPCP
jgi:hypothetical protein